MFGPIWGKNTVTGRQYRKTGMGGDQFCSPGSKQCKCNGHCASGTRNVLTVSNLNGNLLQIAVKNHSTPALVDTGASVSCVSEAFCRKVYPNLFEKCGSPVIGKPAFTAIRGVCGETHPVLGTIELEVNINGLKIRQSFHIFSRLQNTVILGIDFLKTSKAKIDVAQGVISFCEGMVLSPLLTKSCESTNRVSTVHSVCLKPRSQMIITVRVPKNFNDSEALVGPLSDQKNKYLTAKAIAPVWGKYSRCLVLNPTNAEISLKAGKCIGQVTSIDSEYHIESLDSDVCQVSSVSEVASDTESRQKREKYIEAARELNIDLSKSDLNAVQKDKLLEFIGKNRKVFAADLSELGSTSVYKHRIETIDDVPVHSRHYRLSKEMKDLVEKEIDEMLKHKIIEPSTTEWTSPIVMVKKKTGGYRMAADLRQLNAKCRPMHFPLPRAEDVFDTIGQAKANYMSILDCFSGYWQIPLDPETKHKAGFVTHHGIWEWNKLPFGLVSAPAAFQKTMATVLRDLNWKQVLIYVDDILVMSETFDLHLTHLQQVCDRLMDANITLKPSKCHFAAKEVTYLGYVISKDGIKTDPSKTEVMRSYPTPKSQKQLRQAMGLFNFYRRFVQGFSQIAAPLNTLLGKDAEFKWTRECDEAFNLLKSKLIEAPVLGYPDMTVPFTLTTDASGSGIGYILSQIYPDKRETVIAYGGRGLRSNEKNFTVTELECLAILEGIKAYHPYLATSEFTVITDHHALVWLHKTKKETGRLSRWAIQLQGYNFKVEHRKGKKNTNADALSRRDYPPESDNPKTDDLDHADMFVLNTGNSTENEKSEVSIHGTIYSNARVPSHGDTNSDPQFSSIAQLQRECPDCRPYIEYKEKNILPENATEAHRIECTSNSFLLDDEVLYRIIKKGGKKADKDSIKIVLPSSMRQEALEAYHDSAGGGSHQGVQRTIQALQTKYWMPHMNEFVKSYVDSCDVCQKIKRSYLPKVPLHPLPIETECFSRVHMDILGPLPEATDKSKYILLVVDSLSKWPEAFPIPNQEAVTIARTLYREIFTRYGAIKSIVSDRGKNFMSKVVSALSELFQTKRVYTSSFHPQTNAHCERYNSFLIQSMRAYINKDQTNWPELLPGILMAFRLTPAGSSGISPFQLLFGREMKLPFDLNLEPKANLGKDARDCIAEWFQNLKIAKDIAQENIKRSQEEYKRYYDNNAKPHEFHPGDHVLLQNKSIKKGLSPKLMEKYTGPYYVTDKTDKDTYHLRSLKDHKVHKSAVHHNRLKKYNPQEDRQFGSSSVNQRTAQKSSSHSPLDTAKSSTQAAEVDKIIRMVKKGNKKWYYVQWTDTKERTWEPLANVPPKLIQEYHVHRTQTGKARKQKNVLKRK